MKARAVQNRVKAPVTSINCNSRVLEMQLQYNNTIARHIHAEWIKALKATLQCSQLWTKHDRHCDSKFEQKKKHCIQKSIFTFFRNCNKNCNTHWLTRNPKVSKISSVFFLPIFDMSTCNFLTRPLFHRRSSDCSIKTCKSTNRQKMRCFQNVYF